MKLGNLFLTDKLNIKIGDFGLAAKLAFDSERRKTMCGTPNYIAPEILESKFVLMKTMAIRLKSMSGVLGLLPMLLSVGGLPSKQMM